MWGVGVCGGGGMGGWKSAPVSKSAAPVSLSIGKKLWITSLVDAAQKSRTKHRDVQLIFARSRPAASSPAPCRSWNSLFQNGNW